MSACEITRTAQEKEVAAKLWDLQSVSWPDYFFGGLTLSGSKVVPPPYPGFSQVVASARCNYENLHQIRIEMIAGIANTSKATGASSLME